MNVIPNRAMITVTTADSKYSRMTLRGPNWFDLDLRTALTAVGFH